MPGPPGAPASRPRNPRTRATERRHPGRSSPGPFSLGCPAGFGEMATPIPPDPQSDASRPRPVPDVQEVDPCPFGFLEPTGHLLEPMSYARCDVMAGRLAAITDGEGLPDLGQDESGRLRLPNEADPADRVSGIIPVAAGGAFGLRQPSFGLVEPQRLGAHACGPRQFTDQHHALFGLTFLCSGSCSAAIASRCTRSARRTGSARSPVGCLDDGPGRSPDTGW
jgi:hypothetical protein